MPVTLEKLKEQLYELRKRVADAGGEMFMGIPETWYQERKFRCINDHVSLTILKSEEKGDLCLACQEACMLTFPADEEGPIKGISS